MRDWPALLRARMSTLGLSAEREEEIRAELAGHLEDACAEARQRGLSAEDAVAHALAQVPDWMQLAQVIRRAEEEGPMTRDTKTLWLPGMTALAGAAAVMLGITQLVPSSLWTDPRTSARVLMFGLVLSGYFVCGAIGASWSRRAGGNVTARYLAGIFPLALHVAMVILTIVFGVDFRLGGALGFIVIPGIALTAGALPFLRDGATRQAA